MGAYITHILRDHSDTIVYVLHRERPDDGFATERDSILLPFVHEAYCELCAHTTKDHSSYIEANSEYVSVDQEKPPVQTWVCCTLPMHHRLTRQPISNECLDMLDNDVDLWSMSFCKEEYWLAHWCVKHNLSRAAINELFQNPRMVTVSNFKFPIQYSKGWTKCPMQCVWTLRHPAKCVTTAWKIQATFATIIIHVSFSPILLNALSSSCNSLHEGNKCCMLQQRNSMMLRNVCT
jgi:hypothetical protein